LDWLTDDAQLMNKVLESMIFFEQLLTLWSAARGTWRYAPRTDLSVALSSRSELTKAGAERTILSDSPERTNEWNRRTGEVYGPPSGWMERRLSLVVAEPDLFCPGFEWLCEVLVHLHQRWTNQQGNKAQAVVLMRSLKSLGPPLFSAQLPDLQLDLLARALDKWLRTGLDETKDDWLPLFDRLENDHYLDPATDDLLRDEFCDYAREELSRWEPVPPNLQDLIEYAQRFDDADLVQELERSAAREDAREDAEGERIGPSRTMDERGSSPVESAADIDAMFRRLSS
jgi:hypothetical protein